MARETADFLENKANGKDMVMEEHQLFQKFGAENAKGFMGKLLEIENEDEFVDKLMAAGGEVFMEEC